MVTVPKRALLVEFLQLIRIAWGIMNILHLDELARRNCQELLSFSHSSLIDTRLFCIEWPIGTSLLAALSSCTVFSEDLFAVQATAIHLSRAPAEEKKRMLPQAQTHTICGKFFTVFDLPNFQCWIEVNLQSRLCKPALRLDLCAILTMSNHQADKHTQSSPGTGHSQVSAAIQLEHTVNGCERLRTVAVAQDNFTKGNWPQQVQHSIRSVSSNWIHFIWSLQRLHHTQLCRWKLRKCCEVKCSFPICAIQCWPFIC